MPSFPTTGLLDDFTRADATDLGTDYTASRGGFTDPSLQVKSNAVASVGTFSANRWNLVPGNDQEVFLTMTVLPASGHEVVVFARMSTSTKDFYQFHYVPGTGYQMSKCVAGTFTQLGTTDASVASAGDKIGLRCVGTRIEGWYTVAGVWTASANATTSDSTFSSGVIGLGADVDASVTLDDFGGGTVRIQVAPKTPPIPIMATGRI